MRYYFDTCIWVDLLEERNGKGIIVQQLITKIIEENGVIFYSSLTIEELGRIGYTEHDMRRLFTKTILVFTHLKKAHFSISQKVAKKRLVPRKDVLHAYTAADAESVLVTTDRHFEKLKDIVESKTPRELIL
ncbi:MAG: type II toxin-antitoxin system VapC family toxin [Candidatus Woesearchaeota archaeon]|nr:type II toxin-antitoxin system VapC family toxin [Candidatus Woesearchaeota archaeon]